MVIIDAIFLLVEADLLCMYMYIFDVNAFIKLIDFLLIKYTFYIYKTYVLYILLSEWQLHFDHHWYILHHIV